jgi:electron transfer flavoprotein beta subunit
MRIVVAVKEVTALEDDFEIRDDGMDVVDDFFSRDLNEWDDFSLEEAMRIKETTAGTEVEVVVVTVGPASAEEGLRKCLAKGADRAVRIWNDAVVGSDQIVIARILAAFSRRESPDLVFAGVQSSDHSHASTGISVAAFTNRPHVAVVSGLRYTAGAAHAVVQRELEGGLLEELEVECPAVFTIQLGINTPRYASLRGIKQAAARTIEVITPGDLGLGEADVGEAGSLSRVRRMYIPEKGRASMIEGTPAEQAARLAEIIREFRGV